MESDGYEEIGKRIPEPEELQKKPLRPTALQLVTPQKGPSRTLWSEIPEVINSEILCKLEGSPSCYDPWILGILKRSVSLFQPH